MTEFTEGVNTYRIVPIIMQGHNADVVIAEIQKKRETGVGLTREDLIPLLLTPLMSGEMPIVDRVNESLGIIKGAKGNLDQTEEEKMEAVLYTFAAKFLDEQELDSVKEVLSMTRLGEMLREDGEKVKLIRQVKKKYERGISVKKMARELETTMASIQPIYDAVRANPSKSAEEILRIVNQKENQGMRLVG